MSAWDVELGGVWSMGVLEREKWGWFLQMMTWFGYIVRGREGNDRWLSLFLCCSDFGLNDLVGLS